MPLTSFRCLNAEAKTSSTMLNSYDENEHPCLIPHCKGKVLSFFPLRMILTVGPLSMAFMMLIYVQSIPALLIVFIKKGSCILVKFFFYI